jgi:hypothetical protein
MATVTAPQAAVSYPVFHGQGRQLLVANGVYEITAALSAADVIEFLKLPDGAQVVGGFLYGDDIDTGTEALQLDIGTAADPDALLNSGVITGDAVTGIKPETGICYPLFGLLKDGPLAISGETKIIGTVTAAANAGGTGTLHLVVHYYTP